MKIHIIGGPGSGKTWLADRLSAEFNVPAFDLDDIFWDRKWHPESSGLLRQTDDPATGNGCC